MTTQISPFHFLVAVYRRASATRPFIFLLLIPILYSNVGLPPPQPINRASSCNRRQSAKWFAHARGVVLRLFPDLQERLLQDVFRLSLLMDHALDDRAQRFPVSLIQRLERIFIPIRDRAHQRFVCGRTETIVC